VRDNVEAEKACPDDGGALGSKKIDDEKCWAGSCCCGQPIWLLGKILLHKDRRQGRRARSPCYERAVHTNVGPDHVTTGSAYGCWTRPHYYEKCTRMLDEIPSLHTAAEDSDRQ
jgi:hypothetical protein